MKKIIIPFALLALFIFTAFMVKDTADWKLTDKYSIWFTGKKVSGFFHKLKGQITFDENKLSSSRVNLEVEVASITTGNSLKSWHAKRPKWFDAKQFPTISFVSEKFQKTAKGYSVTGKLKMKGVEKVITVPFAFSNKTFFGSFQVRRSDYHVGKTTGMSKTVSDTININFTIPVTN
jgi:polyisoprenoid-binding protein YceI